MIRFLLALTLAAPAPAAVIRGVVVENFTGKLLSRALVTLEALPGTPGGVRTARTGRLGGFEFSELAPGAYVLKASRRGYLPVEQAQKRWNSAGQPIAVEEAGTYFFTLRLPRFSAISGTVVDENGIGLPGHEVAVYRAVEPPEYLHEAVADDRGMYRVSGLVPGRYFIRTVARQYDDGGYLPTFSRETLRPDEAQIVETALELQTDNIDVRPLPGRLFTLTVAVDTEDPETVITIASGMGRKTAKGPVARFAGLPPGEYEVYAETQTDAAYQRFPLSRDTEMSLLWTPFSSVSVSGAPDSDPGVLRMRRRDLAGAGPERAVPANRASLPPGRWDLLLDPPPGYYVSGTIPNTRGRLDGWIEVTARPRFTIGLRLTSGVGAVRGVVKDAPYAPVYLEGYDPAQRRRAGELKTVRADSAGRYQFANLAPGVYRLLSTFEYASPDTDVIDAASPVTVSVEANGAVARDLDLWVIR